MIRKSLLLVVALCAFAGCSKKSSRAAAPVPLAPVPPAPTPAQPIDFGALTGIVRDEAQINSIIVSQDNRIVYEYYQTEGDRDHVYNFYSVAKSVTALLAGVAIDNGYIASENALVGEYIPSIAKEHPDKKDIAIKHLLSMTSGISWPESTTWRHFFAPMMESQNWIRFILERDMDAMPGTAFNYNSGNSHLVSKIIQDTTRMNMFDFGKANLFDKMDMKTVSWYFDPQGVCFGGAWIQMSAKDALKIGQLVLDNGIHNNKQIVSAEWIRKLTSAQSAGYRWNDYVGGEYGYGWWINEYHGQKTFFAWGAHEQYIFVTPSLRLVAVFNGTFANQDATRPPFLYADHIIKPMLGGKKGQ